MSAALSRHLKHRLALWLAGGENVPFHFLFHEPWDRAFRREYRRARAYAGAIRRDAVRRVFVVSYSRSGTHNFYTHLHYLPCVFAFGENIFCDMQNDPYQLGWDWARIRPPHFQYGSAFLRQGLQDKSGDRLTHVLLLSNHYLKSPVPLDASRLSDRDRLFFYQRNFVRTLCSQDKAGRSHDKPHFVMTDDHFARAVANHRRKLDEMLGLAAEHPGRVRFLFHEIFCARPEEVLREACRFAEIEAPAGGEWMDPIRFFRRCYRSGEAPERRGDTLWCPAEDAPIYGKGGDYNPVPPVTLQRTLSDPIREWVPPSRLDLLRRTFGAPLADFWMNDDTFDYRHATGEQLADLYRRSLAESRG